MKFGVLAIKTGTGSKNEPSMAAILNGHLDGQSRKLSDLVNK